MTKEFDAVALSGFMLMVAMIVFTGYDLFWAGHAFDPLTFGGGGAAVLGGHGGAQMLRDRWTPPEPDTAPRSNAER